MLYVFSEFVEVFRHFAESPQDDHVAVVSHVRVA